MCLAVAPWSDMYTLYTNPSKSLNNCLQHESFHQDVKPEVITGGEVDFVNGRNTKVFPAEKSRSSPILRMMLLILMMLTVNMSKSPSDEFDGDRHKTWQLKPILSPG